MNGWEGILLVGNWDGMAWDGNGDMIRLAINTPPSFR